MCNRFRDPHFLFDPLYIGGGVYLQPFRLCSWEMMSITPNRGRTFSAKFGEEGVSDVSQILTRFGRDIGLSHANEIVSISSAV